MVKLNARSIALLSLCLVLAIFAGQPVAANGRGGKKQEDVIDTVKKVVGKVIGGNPGHGGGNPGGGGGGKKKQDVMATVEKVVYKAIADNHGVGAALIRLVFHDCWVNVRA